MNDELRRTPECVGIDYFSCEEAIKRLNEYLDQELTDEEKTVVIKHLEICKPCLNRFSFEHALMLSLRKKVTNVGAPETLKNKLKALLKQEVDHTHAP